MYGPVYVYLPTLLYYELPMGKDVSYVYVPQTAPWRW